MTKKFKIINIMPHILAASAAIAIVIACGEGDILDREIKLTEKETLSGQVARILDSLAELSSSGEELLSSGTELGESSSSEDGLSSGGVESSSSIEAASSSSEEEAGSSSSAAEAPSSSSESLYVPKCSITANPITSIWTDHFGAFDIEEYPIAANCVLKANPDTHSPLSLANDIDWYVDDELDHSFWLAPEEGVYNIGIKIPNGINNNCAGTEATCGTLIMCYKNSSLPACIPSSSSTGESSSGGETSSSSSIPSEYNPTCEVVSTGVKNADVPIPTISCGVDGVTPTAAKFKYISGNGISGNTPKWNNGLPHQFATGGDKPVLMYEISCGGTLIPYGTSANLDGISCGSIYIVDPSSSSSVVTYTLACANVPTTGTVGTAITAPAVTCNGAAVASSAFTWTGAPTWATPAAGIYTGIKATATSGNCSGKEATCAGTLTVAPACSMTQTEYTLGTGGVPVPAPTVNCGTGVSASSAKFTFTGSDPEDADADPMWPVTFTKKADVTVSMAAVSCGGTAAPGLPKVCATIKIKEPSSSSAATLTCNMTATTGTTGTAITPTPIVQCNGTNVTSGLTWTPASLTPTTTGSVAVSVSVSSGICSGMTATCGSVTVSAPSSSSAAAPTATCTWTGGSGKTMYSGQAKPADPTISCSSGAVGTPNWGTTLPPATLEKGTFAPVPTVTCGGVTPSNISSCGTLTVLQAPVIATCAGVATESVTLPATPTKPTVTLTDPDNVCSANGSTAPNASWTAETWTVSKGGSSSSNTTWASLFTTAGTYDTYKVSGTCGAYGSITLACTGSATVSAPADGCVAGSKVFSYTDKTVSTTGNVGTTGAICIKQSNALGGWNASNTSGRSCTPNSGTAVTGESSIGNQSAVPLTSDGFAYINCTAGTHDYMSVSWWY